MFDFMFVREKIVVAIATVALIIGGADASNAAIISVSTTAPTVDGADIANLVAPTASAPTFNDRPVQGQTFTTGSDLGQQLNALTVMISETNGTVFEGWKDYRIRFGTPDSPLTTLTPIINEVARYNPDLVTNTQYYFTFTLDTPIALAANTSYMFDVGVAGSQEGWQSGIPNIHRSGDDYAGGSRTQGSNTNQADSNFNVNTQSGDLIFHADISAAVVPEPASLTVMMSVFGLGLLLTRRRR